MQKLGILFFLGGLIMSGFELHDLLVGETAISNPAIGGMVEIVSKEVDGKMFMQAIKYNLGISFLVIFFGYFLWQMGKGEDDV